MKIKCIMKIFCIVLSSVIFYFYLGILFTPKTTNDIGGQKYYSALAYRANLSGTDMIVLGNSDVYSGFSPMELYDKYGYTSYGFGVAKQTLHSVGKQLKSVLKRQKLKLVILEADILYQPNIKKQGSIHYDYAWLFAPFMYHSRWKDLKLRDFFTLPNLNRGNFTNGYFYSDKVNDFNVKPDYMKDIHKPPQKMEKSINKDFYKIYKLCKKYDVPLLVISIPTPHSWDNAKSNGVKELCERYNLDFYDMNLGLDGFDYSCHFRDNGNHCNYNGAKVVTLALGKYLQENYSLANHKGKSNFENWDKKLIEYKKAIASYSHKK